MLCSACPEHETGPLVAAVFKIIGLLVGLWVLSVAGRVIRSWVAKQRANGQLGWLVGDALGPSISASDPESLSEAERVYLENQQARRAAQQANFQRTLGNKVKVLVSMMQILISYTRTLAVPWPPAFVAFVEAWDFLNLDVLRYLSTGCVVQRSLYTELLGTVVFVCVFVAGLGLAAHISLRVNKSAERHSALIDKLIGWALFGSFLMYTPLSAKIFAVFSCTTFEDGRRVVTADFSLDCDAPDRGIWVAFALVCSFVFSIGVPVTYFSLLWRKRRELNPPARPGESKLALSARRNRDKRVTRYMFLFAA